MIGLQKTYKLVRQKKVGEIILMYNVKTFVGQRKRLQLVLHV